MRVDLLRVDGLRNLRELEWRPGPGLNLLIGANGAGKTSILEAVYCLGSGKSFRTAQREALITRGARRAILYAELELGGRRRRVGLERGRESWRGLVDGERVQDLGALALCLPVVCFSPESHELVAGGAEGRRRFLDWLGFHLSPDFRERHRRYARALRQRNALLKTEADPLQWRTWTEEAARSGEALEAERRACFEVFRAAMQPRLQELIGEMGELALSYRRGWREGVSLLERLEMLAERERVVGHSMAGPHRADWEVVVAGHRAREQTSRGQQKLVALAAVMSAAALYAVAKGEAPLILLDDLASELDHEHQCRALQALAALNAQVWLTGTSVPASTTSWPGELSMFHVEQGFVRA